MTTWCYPNGRQGQGAQLFVRLLHYARFTELAPRIYQILDLLF
jgi:hypothetical protein